MSYFLFMIWSSPGHIYQFSKTGDPQAEVQRISRRIITQSCASTTAFFPQIKKKLYGWHEFFEGCAISAQSRKKAGNMMTNLHIAGAGPLGIPKQLDPLLGHSSKQLEEIALPFSGSYDDVT